MKMGLDELCTPLLKTLIGMTFDGTNDFLMAHQVLIKIELFHVVGG
jgi:hypothetical protein